MLFGSKQFADVIRLVMMDIYPKEISVTKIQKDEITNFN